jgi:ATP adenylyltransferase
MMDPMTTQTNSNAANDLLARVQAVTAQARASGALLSISTTKHYVEQAGIRFIVHLVTGKVSKQYRPDNFGPTTDDRPAIDPFLPYDERLFIADIPPAHVCLLNKFTVIDHHLLLVTRAFERQENPLTRQDFQALWRCLDGIDGLSFYNAGKIAGASQPHKHLQLAPFPLDNPSPARSEHADPPLDFPLEPLFERARFRDEIGIIDAFPFVHGLIRLTPRPEREFAAAAHERYLELFQVAGIKGDTFTPYNLLLTREWMMIAPRSREKVAGISVNSLGFAGSLLARNEDQLRTIEEMGPLTILTSVAVPRP